MRTSFCTIQLGNLFFWAHSLTISASVQRGGGGAAASGPRVKGDYLVQACSFALLYTYT